MDFSGKHIVVTGGTGALGQAVSETFIHSGAQLHIPCINQQESDHFTHRDHPQINLTTAVDLTDEDSVITYYKSLPNPIWASIHLAGGFSYQSFTDISLNDFNAMYQINAMTCFLCCREAVKSFSELGGRIVNVTARPALEPRIGANMVAYTASKAMVAAITQSLAEEMADKDILVNAIAPSIIDTPINRQAMPNADYDLWPKPSELANTILGLSSPNNRVVRGAIVTAYGKS